MKRLVLYIIEWSDDFDPAKSIKDNRGSAWIKTVTIRPPHLKGNECSNTYVIAVGPKGDSHDAVEEAFAKELEELRSGNTKFRVGKLGHEVYVFADIVASLQDQIERRSMNYMMLGGSTFSARWGYACNFNAIWNKLPSCVDCWNSLSSDRSDGGKSCPICYNWEIEGSVFESPRSYPEDVLNANHTKLIATKRITYESLNEAVTMAIDAMSRSVRPWTKTKATSFLGAEGINSEMMAKIFVHVKQLKEARKNAVIPTTWENPIAWRRGIPLSCHIDVPMHLVFLGIVKASVATVNEWIACKGWNLIAESGTNVTLDNIKKT
jgi:hypothetical protein